MSECRRFSSWILSSYSLDNMGVNFVVKKLRDKEYEAVTCDKRGVIWQRFYRIFDRESQTNVDWVQCKTCTKVYKYQSKSGTSHLIRHKCHGLNTAADSSDQAAAEEVKLSTEQSKIILKACVWYCARDLRSFLSITSDGFKLFLRTVFGVRDECGNVSVDELIPHPTTVSRHIVEEAAELRSAILPELLEAVKSGNCAGTIDFWTDNETETTYYTVTLRYVDDTWKIVQRVLFTAELPEKKSTTKFGAKFLQRIEQFGIPQDIIHNITFVTEQDNNIVESLQGYTRLNCTAHLIQSSLRNAFKQNIKLDGEARVFATFQACRNVTAHLIESGLVTRLPVLVYEENDTRWNSEINMLRSVVNQYDDIVQVLSDENELDRIKDYDAEAAKVLLEFLQPFENAITKLQARNSPTLYLVILWVQKLISHCDPEENDSLEMEHIKQEVARYLKQNFVADKLHRVATFLSPPCRKLKMMSVEEKARVFQDINDFIGGGVKTEKAVPTTPNGSKRSKIDFPEWEEFSDCIESCDEIDAYMTVKSHRPGDDLLQWWRTRKEIMPKLAGLAKKIYSVPATSSASEHNFNAAAFVIQERRSRLKPTTIDGILFLHNNLPFDSEPDRLSSVVIR